MNKVFLVGRLANEPKQRITIKGIEQSNFDIAVSDLKSYEDIYFFPCVVWGQQAKYVNTNLRKGSLISIDGHLTKRSYVNNEGRTIYITEVCVDNLRQLLSNKNPSTNNYSTTIEAINNTKELSDLDKVVEIDAILSNTSDEKENLEQSKNEKKFDWEEEI